MLVLALVLSILGCVGMLGMIGYGIWLAFRKSPLPKPLPEGVYRVRVVGRNKITGAPIYDFALEKEEDGSKLTKVE